MEKVSEVAVTKSVQTSPAQQFLTKVSIEKIVITVQKTGLRPLATNLIGTTGQTSRVVARL